MKSWINRLFTSEEEQLRRSFFPDVSIFDGIRDITINITKSTATEEDFHKFLDIVNTFIEQTQGKDLSKLPQNTPEAQAIITIFSLLIYFSNNQKGKYDANKFVQCMQIIIDYTNGIPISKIDSLFFTLFEFLIFPGVDNEKVSSLMKQTMDHPDFVSCISTFAVYKRIVETHFLDEKFEKIGVPIYEQVANMLTGKSAPSLDTLSVMKLFVETLKTKKINEKTALAFLNLTISFLKLNTSMAPEISSYLKESGGYSTILDFCREFFNSKIRKVFSFLCTMDKIVSKECINFITTIIESTEVPLNIVIHIYQVLGIVMQIPTIKSDDFSSISSILQPKQENSDEMSTCVAFLFGQFCVKHFKGVKECMKSVFERVSSSQPSDQSIQSICDGISNIDNEQIKKADIAEAGFLQCFLLKDSPEHLAHIIETFPEFSPIAISIYAADKREDLHWSVLEHLIKSEKFFSNQTKFTQTVSFFYSSSSSSFLASKLMKYIAEEPKESLISIFVNSFSEHEEDTQIFLTCDGLDWLNNLMIEDKISEGLSSIFLSSLVNAQTRMFVSQWITQLPLDHPLFKMPSPLLWHIVFGSSSNTSNVRVPALLPLLQVPSLKLSPMNAYITSKNALSEYIRHNISLDTNKTFSTITNRYVSPETFSYILHNCKATVHHADQSFDHFPLFEFVPGSRDSWISIPQMNDVKGISFWIKAGQEVVGQLLILKTNIITIIAEENKVVATICDETFSFDVPLNKWFMLTIVVAKEFLSNVVIFAINENIQKAIQHDNDVDPFGEILIGSKDNICTDRWYIGASIRLYHTEPSLPYMVSLGPSLMKSTKKEIVIFTPYDKSLIKGEGALLVPYKGFPSYLKERTRFLSAIDLILKSEDPNRISDLTMMLIEAYNVNEKQPKNFWYFIKEILKERVQFIPKRLISYVLLKYEQSETDLSSLYCDLELWELYTEEMASSITRISEVSDQAAIAAQAFFYSVERRFEKSCFIYSCMSNACLYNLMLDVIVLVEETAQLQIISALTQTMLTHFDSNLLSVFNLDKCIDLAIVTSLKVSYKMIDLITLMSSGNQNFIQNSDLLIYSILRHIGAKGLFSRLFSILTGTYIISNDPCKAKFNSFCIARPNLIPLMIFMLLSYIIVAFSARSTDSCTDELEGFEIELVDAMDTFVHLCTSTVKTQNTTASKILNIPGVIHAISFLAPLAFNIGDLRNFTSEDIPANASSTDMFEQIFEHWGVSFAHLSSEMKSSDDDWAPFFQTSISPLLSTIVPLIQRFAPNFNFDEVPAESPILEQTTHFLLYIIHSFESTQNFDFVASSLTFVSTIPTPPLGCSVLSVLMLEPQSVDNIELYIDLSARAHYGGLTPLLSQVSHATNTTFKSPRMKEIIKNQNVVFNIRAILSAILDILNPEESLNIVGGILKIKCVTDAAFSDMKYVFGYFHRIMQFRIPEDPRLPTIIKQFIPFIDKKQFKSQMKGLSELLKGASLFGTTQFPDWLCENKDVYMNCMDIMRELATEFDDKCTEIYTTGNVNEEKINQFAAEIQQCQLDYQESISKYPMLIRFLSSVNRDICLRRMEMESMLVFNSLNSYQMCSPFQAKNFILGRRTWPGETPNVNVPSPLELPHIGLEDHKINFFEVPNPEQKNIIEIKNANHCLYAKNFTPFAASINKETLPIRFSNAVIDNQKILLYTFLTTFGKHPTQVKNCKFLKYSEPIPSVFVSYEKCFYILIGATLKNNNTLLELQEMPSSPIVYSSLSHQITLGLFGTVMLFCGHFVIRIKTDDMLVCRSRYYNYQHNTFEIYSWFSTDFDLIFDQSEGFPTILSKLPQEMKTITPRIGSTSLPTLTEEWRNNKIATYDYLLGVNYVAGRSFCDLSQYPVFPWIMSDYEDKLPNPDDTENADIGRDLRVPMGMIGKQRAEIFLKTYNDTDADFQFGSHYSMAASVHFFLLRSPPHTMLDWDLHNGWDNPAREFFDVGYSWKSSSELNNNDVKELIPEFFSFPDFLINKCHFETQDVVLPKWAKSAQHFVTTNRFYLNKATHLEAWLDLIFGVNQSGPNAEKIGNLFRPVTYFRKQQPNEDMEMLALQLVNWGQCPIPQFQKQHPPKEPEEKHEQNSYKLEWVKIPNFIPIYSHSVVVANNNKNIKADKHKLRLTFNEKSFLCIPIKDVLMMSASQDGNIVVIDTSMNEVLVYFLEEAGNAKLIGSRSFDSRVKSIIDGTSLICFSFAGKNGVAWDISRGSTLYEVCESVAIIDAIFLEEDFSLAVLTPTSLTIRTCNNLVVASRDFSVAATCFCQTKEGFAVGFGDGTAQIINFNRITCTLDVQLTSHPCPDPITTVSFIDETICVATTAKTFYKLK